MATIDLSRTVGGVVLTVNNGSDIFITNTNLSIALVSGQMVFTWGTRKKRYTISGNLFSVDGVLVSGTAQQIVDAFNEWLQENNSNLDLRYRKVVNVLNYGADSSGVADSSAAFTSAIAAASGGSLYVPQGTYLVTNVAITAGLKIEGEGGLKSILKPSSGGSAKSIFSVATGVDDWAIRRVGLYGYNTTAGDESSNSLITNNTINGININGINQRWTVDNCLFYGFNGFGVYAENASGITNQYLGGVISNSIFRRNFCGAYIGQRIEYCSIYSNGFYENTTGCWNKGGNNKYTSNSFKASYTGFFLDAGFNDAHGSLVGNDFNHCNVGFQAGATGNGEVIAGNSFQQCSIVCVSSAGLNFSGNNINIPSPKTITLTNVIGYFAHNNISSTPSLSITGTGGLFEFGNYTNTGASYHLFANPAIDINGAVVINHDATQAFVVNGQITSNPVTNKSGIVVNQNASTVGLKVTGGTNPYLEVLNGSDGIKMQHAGSVGLIATESNIPLSLYANNTQMLKIFTAGRAILQNGGTFTDDAVNTLQVTGSIKATQFRMSALHTAPSSASDTGTLGEVRWTASFVYLCIATNTWVRAALATW